MSRACLREKYLVTQGSQRRLGASRDLCVKAIERVPTSILLVPPSLPALRNEHPARNDRPRLGKFSRAAEWLFEFAVLRPADDGELVSPACRH